MSAGGGGDPTGEEWQQEDHSRRQTPHKPPPVAAVRHARRWPFLLQLFVCLFFVLLLPVSVSSEVICAHANSTCSNCSALCGVAQFFTLLPSPCHPEFPATSYDYGSSSFSLSNASLSSPMDLLPTNLDNSFSLSTRFNRTSANGTLLELETGSVTVSLSLVDGVPQVTLGTDSVLVAANMSSEGVSNHIVVSFENATTDTLNSLNVSMYLNGDLEGSLAASLTFPTSVRSATIGTGFTGLLKDVGIYVPALSEADLDPTPANLVPQCLCYPGTISTTNTSLCNDSTIRYDETAHVVEFLFDDSNETYWESAVGETPVTVTLRLASVTNHSKIFISFVSALPTFATLEYMDDSQWVPLQYWADNCTSAGINESASTLPEAICTSTQGSGTSLQFLIAAGGRPIATNQEDVFQTDQLRLTLDGLATGASQYAIREFEVCTTYCTDTSSTCDCTQLTDTTSSGLPTEVVSTTDFMALSTVAQPFVTSSDTVGTTVMAASQMLSPTPTSMSPTVVLTADSSSLPAQQTSDSVTETTPDFVSQTTSDFVPQPTTVLEASSSGGVGSATALVSSESRSDSFSSAASVIQTSPTSSQILFSSVSDAVSTTPAVAEGTATETSSFGLTSRTPVPETTSQALTLPSSSTIDSSSTRVASTPTPQSTVVSSTIPILEPTPVTSSAAVVQSSSTSTSRTPVPETTSQALTLPSSSTIDSSSTRVASTPTPQSTVVSSTIPILEPTPVTSSAAVVQSSSTSTSRTPVPETTSQALTLPSSSTIDSSSTRVASTPTPQTTVVSSTIPILEPTPVTSSAAVVQSSSTSTSRTPVPETTSQALTLPSSSSSSTLVASTPTPQSTVVSSTIPNFEPTPVTSSAAVVQSSSTSTSRTPVPETTSQALTLPSSSSSSTLVASTSTPQTTVISSTIPIFEPTPVTSSAAVVQSSSTSTSRTPVPETTSQALTLPSSSTIDSSSTRVASTSTPQTTVVSSTIPILEPTPVTSSAAVVQSSSTSTSRTPVPETTSQPLTLPSSSTIDSSSTQVASTSTPQTTVVSSTILIFEPTPVTSSAAVVQSSSTSTSRTPVPETTSQALTLPSSSTIDSSSTRVASTSTPQTTVVSSTIPIFEPTPVTSSAAVVQSSSTSTSRTPVPETTSQALTLPSSSSSSTRVASTSTPQTTVVSSTIPIFEPTPVTSSAAVVQSSSTSTSRTPVPETTSQALTLPSSSSSSTRVASTSTPQTTVVSSTIPIFEPTPVTSSAAVVQSSSTSTSRTPVPETTSQALTLPSSSSSSTRVASTSTPQTTVVSSTIPIFEPTPVTSSAAVVQSSSTSTSRTPVPETTSQALTLPSSSTIDSSSTRVASTPTPQSTVVSSTIPILEPTPVTSSAAVVQSSSTSTSRTPVPETTSQALTLPSSSTIDSSSTRVASTPTPQSTVVSSTIPILEPTPVTSSAAVVQSSSTSTSRTPVPETTSQALTLPSSSTIDSSSTRVVSTSTPQTTVVSSTILILEPTPVTSSAAVVQSSSASSTLLSSNIDSFLTTSLVVPAPTRTTTSVVGSVSSTVDVAGTSTAFMESSSDAGFNATVPSTGIESVSSTSDVRSTSIPFVESSSTVLESDVMSTSTAFVESSSDAGFSTLLPSTVVESVRPTSATSTAFVESSSDNGFSTLTSVPSTVVKSVSSTVDVVSTSIPSVESSSTVLESVSSTAVDVMNTSTPFTESNSNTGFSTPLPSTVVESVRPTSATSTAFVESSSDTGFSTLTSVPSTVVESASSTIDVMSTSIPFIASSSDTGFSTLTSVPSTVVESASSTIDVMSTSIPFIASSSDTGFSTLTSEPSTVVESASSTVDVMSTSIPFIASSSDTGFSTLTSEPSTVVESASSTVDVMSTSIPFIASSSDVGFSTVTLVLSTVVESVDVISTFVESSSGTSVSIPTSVPLQVQSSVTSVMATVTLEPSQTVAQSSDQMTTVIEPTVQISTSSESELTQSLTATITSPVQTSTSPLPGVTSTEVRELSSSSIFLASEQPAPSSTFLTTRDSSTISTTSAQQSTTVLPSPTPTAPLSSSLVEEAVLTTSFTSESSFALLPTAVPTMTPESTPEVSSQSVELTVLLSNTAQFTSSEVFEATSSVAVQVSSPVVTPTAAFTTIQASPTIDLTDSSSVLPSSPVETVVVSTTLQLVPEESTVIVPSSMVTQDVTSSSIIAPMSLELSVSTTPVATLTSSVGLETTPTPFLSSSAVLAPSSSTSSQALVTSFLLQPTTSFIGATSPVVLPSFEVTPTLQTPSTSSVLLEPTPTSSLLEFTSSVIQMLTPSPTQSESVFSSSLFVVETPTSSFSVVVSSEVGTSPVVDESQFISPTTVDILTSSSTVVVDESQFISPTTMDILTSSSTVVVEDSQFISPTTMDILTSSSTVVVEDSQFISPTTMDILTSSSTVVVEDSQFISPTTMDVITPTTVVVVDESQFISPTTMDILTSSSTVVVEDSQFISPTTMDVITPTTVVVVDESQFISPTTMDILTSSSTVVVEDSQFISPTTMDVITPTTVVVVDESQFISPTTMDILTSSSTVVVEDSQFISPTTMDVITPTTVVVVSLTSFQPLLTSAPTTTQVGSLTPTTNATGTFVFQTSSIIPAVSMSSFLDFTVQPSLEVSTIASTPFLSTTIGPMLTPTPTFSSSLASLSTELFVPPTTFSSELFFPSVSVSTSVSVSLEITTAFRTSTPTPTPTPTPSFSEEIFLTTSTTGLTSFTIQPSSTFDVVASPSFATSSVQTFLFTTPIFMPLTTSFSVETSFVQTETPSITFPTAATSMPFTIDIFPSSTVSPLVTPVETTITATPQPTSSSIFVEPSTPSIVGPFTSLFESSVFTSTQSTASLTVGVSFSTFLSLSPSTSFMVPVTDTTVFGASSSILETFTQLPTLSLSSELILPPTTTVQQQVTPTQTLEQSSSFILFPMTSSMFSPGISTPFTVQSLTITPSPTLTIEVNPTLTFTSESSFVFTPSMSSLTPFEPITSSEFVPTSSSVIGLTLTQSTPTFTLTPSPTSTLVSATAFTTTPLLSEVLTTFTFITETMPSMLSTIIFVPQTTTVELAPEPTPSSVQPTSIPSLIVEPTSTLQTSSAVVTSEVSPTPFVSSPEVLLSFTSFVQLPETSSVLVLQPTSTVVFEQTPSTFEFTPSPVQSVTPTPEASFTSSVLAVSSTPVLVVESSSSVLAVSSTPVLVVESSSSVLAVSSTPVLVVESSSSVLAASSTPVLVVESSSSVLAASSTPVLVVESSSSVLAVSSTPVLVVESSSSVLAVSSTPVLVVESSSSVLAASSTPVLVVESSSSVLAASSTPILASMSSVLATSTPILFAESSSFFFQPTSTLVAPPSSTPLLSLALSSSPASTQVLFFSTSSSVVQAVTTTASLPFSMSPTPTPTPEPSSIPRLPPLAPLTLVVDGLGSPLQDRPIRLNDSDGLRYEANVGAYIGITGDDTVGRVNVSFGEFSGHSDQYSQVPSSSVNIEATLASNEIWPDNPRIVLAVQVRDSLLLSTRELNQENVTAEVNRSSFPSARGSCKPDTESGVCVIHIALHDSWFTASNDTTVDVHVSHPFGNTTTLSATLRPTVSEDNSSSLFMVLPMRPVFPGDEISISVYARYEYLLTSFSLICSVGTPASILGFTGPTTWSLVQSFEASDSRQVRGSVTGFRNYDTNNVAQTNFEPELLTTLSVDVGHVSSPVELSVKCKAVGLLLTTKDRPEIDIYANATDRVRVRSGQGLLFAQPISVIKHFAHSSINQLINIAYLTGIPQYLNLSVQAFHVDGSLTPLAENLTCLSQNQNITKVESDCSCVYLNGTETTGGETNIVIMEDNSTSEIPFRVWLPDDTYIELENDTLNKIDTPECSDNSTILYQTTRVHVVTTLHSLNQPSIESVYITSEILPYLKTNDSNIIQINDTSGEVMVLRAGSAEIYCEGTRIDSRQVTASDVDPVTVLYLDVFAFSSINVSLIGGNNMPTAVDISLLQDFAHVNSEVSVVGVAVFSDGRRQVIDPGSAIITPTTNGTLSENQRGRYMIIESVSEVGFKVQWIISSGCIIEDENVTSFNSSTPTSLSVSVDSSTVAPEGDIASLVGTPDAVNLVVYLVYEDREVDITLNSNTRIQLPDDLIIENGVIKASGSMTNGTANITVDFENLVQETTITVVRGIGLNVLAHPFPPYEGSGNVPVTTIKKIGSSFQMVEIEVKVMNSDGTEHTVPMNSVLLQVMPGEYDNELNGSVLALPDNAASPVTIRAVFGSLAEELDIMVENEELSVETITNMRFTPHGLNQYQIEFGITFEGGISHTTISTSQYPNLNFTSTASDVIDITDTGIINVLSNFNELIEICAISKTNASVSTCTNFTANLQPGSGEIDLGYETGVPFVSVDGSEVTVPVFLNLNYSSVGIFEMALKFDSGLLDFSDLAQGSDWESGQIVYVPPAGTENSVSFGGILHAGAQGPRLHLADVVFTTDGVVRRANFSANVSFIAMNDVNTTPLATDAQRVSDSSRISVEIDSDRRRRDAYEPPLAPPPVQGHGIRRLRRETDSADCNVVGDTNGDCVVDLRDVYRLQLYVAESVLNFSSSTGQQLQQTIDETTLTQLDLDGDGELTLTDILELELVTQNLAYEADFNATVDFNATIDRCAIDIYGHIESLSGERPPAEAKVQLIIEFLSTESDFAGVFANMTFASTGIDKSDAYRDPYYGGKVRMALEPEPVETDFRLYGTVEALSVSFNVSVAVVVTKNGTENEVLAFSSEVSNFEEAQNLLSFDSHELVNAPGIIASGVCVSPSTSLVGMPSTSSIAPTPSPSVTTTLGGETTSAGVSTSNTSPSSIAPTTSPSVSQFATVGGEISSASISSTSSIRAAAFSSSSVSQLTSVSEVASDMSSTTISSTISTQSQSPTPSPLSSSLPSQTSTSRTQSEPVSSSPISPPATSPSPSTEPSTTTDETSTAPSTQPTVSSSTTVPSRSSIGEQATTTSSAGVGIESSMSKPSSSSSVHTPQTSSISSTTTPPPLPEDEPIASSSVNSAAIIGGVLGTIILLLIMTLVGIGLVKFTRRKKGRFLVDQSSGVHIRRNSMISNGSNDFWRQTENGIEMSPFHSNIDIVPLDHYGSMIETNIDVVANHNIIMSDDPYGSTSLKPLVPNGNSPERGPPKKGPAPMGSRALQSASYADTGTVHTGATTMVGYTSSSMERSTDYDEDEDEGQLVLPDYDASQAYLSLGLTPLSQLSPDAHTSTDFGYFPSMPPPVASSTSSIFSTTPSNSSLAMDNPFSLHSGGGGQGNGIIDSSMMPDAIPERRGRRNKYDAQPLSQGFPLRLEPVLEQSPSNSQFSGKQNGLSSSESSKGSPSLSMDQFNMFPSAVPTQEFCRLSQGRTALRVKRPGGKGSSRENLNAVSPKRTTAQGGGYGSLGTSRQMGRFKPSPSPTMTRRHRQTRDLRQQEEHEENMRPWAHNPRDSPEPQPMGNGFVNGHRSPPLRSTSETHFNSVEMMKRPSSRTRKNSSTSNGSTSQSSPHKWTPRHASLDDSPVKSYRAEHSDSARLYTTYQHR